MFGRLLSLFWLYFGAEAIRGVDKKSHLVYNEIKYQLMGRLRWD
jgi:hypothetical protein